MAARWCDGSGRADKQVLGELTIKILFIGDVHLSDTTPRSRKDNYTEAIFGKLDQCAEISKGYDYVVFLGDLFHKKKPENNSHYLVSTFMKVLEKFPKGRTFALVGNHDIRDGNMACLPEQPLGVIFQAGLIQELTKDVMLAPWPVYPGMTEKTWVQLSPLPFSYESETDAKFYDCERDKRAHYVIRLTHASILPVGLPFLAYKMPHVSAEQIWGQKWDLLVNGHIHHHSEVMSRGVQSGNQHFVNIGAVARGALNSWALEQSPRIFGVEVKADGEGLVHTKFEWHDLKVAPAAEIFRVEEAVMMKDRKADMALFVSQIKANEGTAERPVVNLNVMLDEYLTDNRATPVVARKVRDYVGIK